MFDYMDANRCKEMTFAFVRLPILLFTAAAYKSLSIDAREIAIRFVLRL